jgi:hypothetical protein
MSNEETMQLALQALINGKKVRAGEGGTLYQPPLEDAAIAALQVAILSAKHSRSRAFPYGNTVVQSIKQGQ